MPHRRRRRRGNNYSTPRGTHIAFKGKRSIKVSFSRASRKSKRYLVIVSRNHVHIIRIRARRKKVGRRQVGRRRHRMRRRRRSRRR